MDTIDFDLDEANELMFRVKIEGLKQAPSQVRLVCEGEEISYVFKGVAIESDIVRFNIPAMAGKIDEGIYASRVEVLVENRYFAPVAFDVNFKKPVAVVAEAIKRKPQESKVSVSVTPMTLKERFEFTKRKK